MYDGYAYSPPKVKCDGLYIDDDFAALISDIAHRKNRSGYYETIVDIRKSPNRGSIVEVKYDDSKQNSGSSWRLSEKHNTVVFQGDGTEPLNYDFTNYDSSMRELIVFTMACAILYGIPGSKSIDFSGMGLTWIGRCIEPDYLLISEDKIVDVRGLVDAADDDTTGNIHTGIDTFDDLKRYWLLESSKYIVENLRNDLRHIIGDRANKLSEIGDNELIYILGASGEKYNIEYEDNDYETLKRSLELVEGLDSALNYAMTRTTHASSWIWRNVRKYDSTRELADEIESSLHKSGAAQYINAFLKGVPLSDILA